MFVATTHLPDPHDPFKDPAWRWQRSGYLFDHGRPPLRQDDALTHQAWRFRRALNRCRTEVDREQLAQDYPALTAAHAFFTTAEPLRRAEMEARLLAGSDDRTVAGKLGLSPAAVAAYHGLFFDVRPHLDAHVFILGVVLGGKPFGVLEPDDREAILKILGYQLGGEAVDAVLDFLANPPNMPASLDRLGLPELKQLRDKLRVKIAVLLLTTPAAAARPETWQQIWGQYTAARRATQGGGEGAVASIHGLLDLVTGLSMGGQAKADEAAA
jgi:hypothetical protein